MRLRKSRFLGFVAAFLAICLASPAGAGVPCEPRITGKVFDTGDPEQVARWGPAKERLLRVQDRVGQEVWNRVANDCIDLLDPNLGTLERVTVHDWVKLTANSAVTDSELADVIQALNTLRDSSGRLHVGLLTKPGLGDGSTRWIKNAAGGNRGFFYEVVASRNLIEAGVVDSNRIRGFGIRLLNVEGDLVEDLVGGGMRFIDFKAADGAFKLDQLENVRTALLSPDSPIKEFVYAVETESFPGDWVNRLQDINDELRDLGRPPIQVMRGGTFR